MKNKQNQSLHASKVEASPSSDDWKMPGNISRAYIVSIVVIVLTLADSIGQYLSFTSWQIIADAVGLGIALTIIFVSFIYYSQHEIRKATNLLPWVIFFAYAPGDLFLKGVTFYNLFSGILLFVIVYFIFRATNPLYWLRLGFFYIVSIIIFTQINIWEKFDITLSPSWGTTLPIITFAISALLIWQLIRNFPARTIQMRLLFLLIGIGLIPTMLITASTTLIRYQTDRNQAEAYLETVSSLKMEQVGVWLSSLSNDLSDVQQSVNFIRNADFLINYDLTESSEETTRRSLRTSLESLTRTNSPFTELFIVNSEGTIIISTNPLNEGNSESDQEFFSSGIQGEYISPLSVNRFNGQPSISLAQPIINTEAEVIGVLVSTVNASYLNQIIPDPIQLGEDGEAYLVSEENQLLTNLNNTVSIIPGETLTNWQFDPEPTQGQTLMSSYDNANGLPVLSARTYLPNLKAYLVIEQTEFRAFQALRTNIIITLTLTFAALFITVFIAFTSARNISQPIQLLSTEAEKVWRGEVKTMDPIERTDEIGSLSQILSSMTEELAHTTENLEQVVSERTATLERRAKYLQTTSEISQTMTSIYHLDDLLTSTTQLISDNFGFYHVGIFLVDEENEFAHLKAANSEGGWRMLARAHKLKVGEQGIVGYVTQTGKVRVQQQVEGEDGIYYANPDLPYTKSEIALPLKVGNDILGALDVQSIEETAFTEEDISVLTVLADAVAVAIQNTRLVEQLQERLDAERRLYGELTRESWVSMASREKHLPAYRSDPSGTHPLEVSSHLQPDNKTAVETTTYHPPTAEQPYHSLSVPVKVRGGTVIAVIETKKNLEAGAWKNEEIEILESISNQIAIALENARLFEETQRTAQRERISADLAAKIWASADVENILQTAVRELGSTLQATQGTIRLNINEETPTDKQHDGANHQ